jgi:hypothetical protein
MIRMTRCDLAARGYDQAGHPLQGGSCVSGCLNTGIEARGRGKSRCESSQVSGRWDTDPKIIIEL